MEEEQKEEKVELTQEQKGNWIKFLQERKKNLLALVSYRKVKSVGRAMKRNRINASGNLISARPFNNRANTSKRKGVHSRVFNDYKKKLYETFKRVSATKSVQ